MLTHIISAVGAFCVHVISAGGYAGIAALMALESACTPLPSELVMPFAGYLVTTGRFNLWLVATAGALGCNIGSTVAYAIGAWGGRPFVERWGRYLLLDPGSVDKAQAFFARHGSAAVFFGRLLPVIRTFIALPAGIARMPMLPFQLYTFAGSWPWCLGLAYIGERLGRAWDSDPRLRTFMHSFDLVVAAAILLGVGWFVWTHLRLRTA